MINIEQGDEILLEDMIQKVKDGGEFDIVLKKSSGEKQNIKVKHSMSERQIQVLLKGGIINDFRDKLN